MADKITMTLELYPSQLEYLQRMAGTHGLPDESKAIRCLINYAVATPEQETELFQTIRCRDC